MASRAKVQHYVPQFLLRNFGVGKKKQVHVLDMETLRSFRSHTRNVASESRFYDFRLGEAEFSVDPYLQELEGKTARVFSGLLKSRSLRDLGETDRAVLAEFLAVQLVRTRAFRERFREMPAALRSHLEETHESIADSLQDDLQVPSQEEVQAELARFVVGAPATYAPAFLNKIWLLLRAPSEGRFIIGDNPLSLHNPEPSTAFGNIGLVVPKIQVFLPLSPRFALGMFCSTYSEYFDANPFFARAVSSDRPLSYSPQNLLHFNWLQVAHAERFLFSSRSDFRQVRRMVAKEPELRRPRRPTIG